LFRIQIPTARLCFRRFQKLRDQNEQIFYTTQVQAEFWVVCTRPATARGGYGLSPAKTERKDDFKRFSGIKALSPSEI